jgi:hypothetical protein
MYVLSEYKWVHSGNEKNSNFTVFALMILCFVTERLFQRYKLLSCSSEEHNCRWIEFVFIIESFFLLYATVRHSGTFLMK